MDWFHITVRVIVLEQYARGVALHGAAAGARALFEPLPGIDMNALLRLTRRTRWVRNDDDPSAPRGTEPPSWRY